MREWPLKTVSNVFIYGFLGVFDAGVFGELAVHAGGGMIIFTSGPLQRFTFSDKFSIQSATRQR